MYEEDEIFSTCTNQDCTETHYSECQTQTEFCPIFPNPVSLADKSVQTDNLIERRNLDGAIHGGSGSTFNDAIDVEAEYENRQLTLESKDKSLTEACKYNDNIPNYLSTIDNQHGFIYLGKVEQIANNNSCALPKIKFCIVCPYCDTDARFSSITNYINNHYKLQHMEPDQKYRCLMKGTLLEESAGGCGSIFKSRDAFVSHINKSPCFNPRQVKAVRHQVTCLFCWDTFKGNFDLKNHLKMDHGASSIPNKNGNAN